MSSILDVGAELESRRRKANAEKNVIPKFHFNPERIKDLECEISAAFVPPPPERSGRRNMMTDAVLRCLPYVTRAAEAFDRQQLADGSRALHELMVCALQIVYSGNEEFHFNPDQIAGLEKEITFHKMCRVELVEVPKIMNYAPHPVIAEEVFQMLNCAAYAASHGYRKFVRTALQAVAILLLRYDEELAAWGNLPYDVKRKPTPLDRKTMPWSQGGGPASEGTPQMLAQQERERDAKFEGIRKHLRCYFGGKRCTIAEFLNTARQDCGITAATIAEAAGISKTALSTAKRTGGVFHDLDNALARLCGVVITH